MHQTMKLFPVAREKTDTPVHAGCMSTHTHTHTHFSFQSQDLLPALDFVHMKEFETKGFMPEVM